MTSKDGGIHRGHLLSQAVSLPLSSLILYVVVNRQHAIEFYFAFFSGICYV